MFVLVAGIRARTISLAAGLIEATTAQSAQAWREVIAGAGVKRAEVAGSGAFEDSMSDALLRATFFAGARQILSRAFQALAFREGRS